MQRRKCETALRLQFSWFFFQPVNSIHHMNEMLALDAMKKSKHDKKSRDLVKQEIYLRTRGQGLKKYAQPMSCGTDKYVGSLPD
jgi:hypothetical protein